MACVTLGVCRGQSLSYVWHPLQQCVYNRLRQYQLIFVTEKLPLPVFSEISFLLHQHVEEKELCFVNYSRCPTQTSGNTKTEYTLCSNTTHTTDRIPLEAPPFGFFRKHKTESRSMQSGKNHSLVKEVWAWVKSTVLALLSSVFSWISVPFIIVYSADSSEQEEKYMIRIFFTVANSDWYLTTAWNSTKARTQLFRNSEVHKWFIFFICVLPLAKQYV